MADKVNNYQCPACTGPLHYVGSSGKLECDYCGSTYEVSEIEKLYEKKEEKAEEAYQKTEESTWDTSDLSREWGADAAAMKTYQCPSCGAELICEETTAATSCPYCGNPTVIPGKFSGGLKPDYIIPFKLDQKTAEKTLKNFYRGKRFLPSVFTSENRIREIKGVYVPFWLYDGVVEADARFQASITHAHREGDYEVVEVRHFEVQRAGNIPFEKVPVDASTKMPNDYMDSLEPFDYRELKPFSTAYLPGFLADQYDESAEKCAERADIRAKKTALDLLAADVTGYTSCVMTQQQVRLHRGKVKYGLLPVYLLTSKWKGENYLFAMNGQTGKFVGNLPVDKRKYWSWFLGIAAGITVVFGSALLWLLS